jgi:hypothetical protein
MTAMKINYHLVQHAIDRSIATKLVFHVTLLQILERNVHLFRKTVTAHLISVENVYVFFTVLSAHSIADYLFRLKRGLSVHAVCLNT